jgi:hypothetical protein
MATEIKYMVSFQNRMFLSTSGNLVQSGDSSIEYFSTLDSAANAIETSLSDGDYMVTTLITKS